MMRVSDVHFWKGMALLFGVLVIVGVAQGNKPLLAISVAGLVGSLYILSEEE